MGLPGSRGILAAADSDEIRRPAGIPMPGVHFAPAPYCFSCPIGHTYPACKRGGDTLACIDAMEHLIRTLGPGLDRRRRRRADLRRRHVPSARGVPAPAARADARVRDPVDRRRGHDRLRAHRQGVRLPALARCHARPHGARQGHDLGDAARRRRRHEPRRQRGDGSLPLGDHQHVRRPPGRDGRGRREHRVDDRGARARAGDRARRPPRRGACGSCATAIRASPRSRARGCSGRSSSCAPTARASASPRTTATPSRPGKHEFSPSLFLAGECAKRGVALATAPPNTLRIGPPLTHHRAEHRPRRRGAARGAGRARTDRSPAVTAV